MRLDYFTDEGAERRATLGLIVLQADETIEADFRDLLDDRSLRLHHARIPSDAEVTTETLARMGDTLTATAALLPGEAGIQVIGYGCTSGATVLGEATVERLVRQAHPGVKVSNPLTALKAACRALGVRRLGLLSPYEPPVSAALIAALEADGIEIAGFSSFDQKEERLVVRISTGSIIDAMLHVGAQAPCDAVFASCTNLRATEVLAEAESAIGVPALASNQVLAWHMLRLAGVDDDLGHAGRLWQLGLAG